MIFISSFIIYLGLTFVLFSTIPNEFNKPEEKWDNFKHCLWWPLSLLGLLWEGIIMIWHVIRFKLRKKD